MKDNLKLGRDDIFKVDCKESFSFFNTEKALEENVLAFFTDFKHDGRFVNVEVSQNKGGGRNKNRGGGKRRSDRRSGGGKRSENRRSERRLSADADRFNGNKRSERRSSIDKNDEHSNKGRSTKKASKQRRSKNKDTSTDIVSSRPRRSRR